MSNFSNDAFIAAARAVSLSSVSRHSCHDVRSGHPSRCPSTSLPKLIQCGSPLPILRTRMLPSGSAACASIALSGFGIEHHSKLSFFAACSKIFFAFPDRALGTGTTFTWQWFPPFERNARCRSKTTTSRPLSVPSSPPLGGSPPPPAAKHFRSASRYLHISSAADGAIAAKDGACSIGTIWQ
eukprot:30841-Pelagococcus_subviridis.AAC.3